MLKQLSIFYFLLFYCLVASSQTQPGKTYALIIGIANYESREIPNLSFSNKDAEQFAEWLRSPAGGSVPADNIRLFIDTTATMAAIYNSLEWLRLKCVDDRDENPNAVNTIYFYYSGHGDLESQTLKQLGFLLCYNTPANNYLNNALRIEDLNYYANTLSAKLNSKVILITDACHSGKLAGSDNRGSFMVGKELSKARENEIRIASCLPEELSNEDAAWGGGRGVFSYYLEIGLKGLADSNKDSSVTLNEIKNYLEFNLANDAVLKDIKKRQTPVLKGKDLTLARVNPQELAIVQHSILTTQVILSDQERVFNILGNRDILEFIDFGLLLGLPKEKIADNLIAMISDLQDSTISKNKISGFEYISNNGNVWEEIKQLDSKKEMRSFISRLRLLVDSSRKDPKRYTDIMGSVPDSAKKFVESLDNLLRANREFFEQFKATLHSDPQALQSFIESLVELLHNSGQRIVNLYLEGDVAELERRSYYYSRSGYDAYINMYKLALQLVPADLPLARILKLNLNYFSGLVTRLKITTATESEQKKLIEIALGFQNLATAMEPEAAFVHNELGILFWSKKDFTSAKKHFIRATELAPDWALPWANLSGLYGYTKEFDKGIAAGQAADSLKADLHTSAIQQGYLYEQKGNLLFAEEYYRKAIDINSRHYFPFERLGYVYMNTTNYAAADSFFHEADLRKRGYHFQGNSFILNVVAAPGFEIGFPQCQFNPDLIKKDDIVGLFYWGIVNFRGQNYKMAEQVLKRIIPVDPNNPLVFHYLGVIFYRQQRWEEAEIMFRFALKNYLDETAFQIYRDSVNAKASYSYGRSTRECFEQGFVFHHYRLNEDYYFLASVYEKWDHYDEAEIVYRQIIDQDDWDVRGYGKLWQLMEKQGRFTEAEEVIRKHESINIYSGPPELIGFYQRMMERYPEDGNWPHKLGLYLYDTAFASNYQYLDTVIFFPLMNREMYMGLPEYQRFKDDPLMRLDVGGSNTPTYPIELQKLYEATVTMQLPGTNEEFTTSKSPILTPRKEAIYYLSIADSLLTEEDTRSDINYKIGNLYIRAGSGKMAGPFYERAVKLNPGNINARMKLADTYKAIYKNRGALEQLNYLYDSSRINFSQRLMLAEFLVHEGKIEKAGKLLTDGEKIYPYAVPATYDLLGRASLLSNKTTQAISYYQTYLKYNPSDAHVYYTIARLYQRSGNKKQAMQWLKEALNIGFNYSWVLMNDEVWTSSRNTTEWKKLLAAVSMKQYQTPLH